MTDLQESRWRRVRRLQAEGTEIMEPSVDADRMLKWFAYAHLPEKLQDVSRPFGELANHICDTVLSGPERTVALRKLLESKDAAVRAVVQPGG